MPCLARCFRALLLALVLAAPAVGEDIDVLGTWYVLVHYKDDNASNPDTERWEDKVWVFGKKGRSLTWTEYPIVVFDDETGRFERRHTGQYARILHFWEPTAVQRRDIRDGLQVNSRGSKNKRLRGSDADGWSSSRSSGAASASMVTYEEVWSIEGLPSRPVFSRADYMGSGRTDTMEGLTQYATTKVVGGLLHGTFERDGTRRGTFEMQRSGEVGALKGAKDQKELQEKTFRRQVESAVRNDPEVRAQTEGTVKDGLAEVGIFVGSSDLDRLVTSVLEWNLQGVPDKEVKQRLGEQMIADYWSFAPQDASHDEKARYAFPFEASPPRTLLMGVGTELGAVGRTGPLGQFEHLARHTGFASYAFKFGLPPGTAVLAARAGEVARVVDGFKGQRGEELGGNPNAVWILHEDGTAGLYLHLADGISVRPGDTVKAGDALGRSGKPGFVDAPLLHFGVIRVDAAGQPQSVEIRFDDGSAAGVVPVAGQSYPSS